MIIKKLYIKNFRGFEDCILTFDSNLSVICGVNGSGKTSVLEALCVALGGWLIGFDQTNSADKRTIKNKDIRYTTASINNAFLGQVPVEVTCDAEVYNIQYSWRRIRKYISPSVTSNYLSDLSSLTRNLNAKVFSGDDSDIVLPVIAYYSAARLWNVPVNRSKVFSKPKNRLDGYKGALSFSNSNNDAMAVIDRIAFQAYRNQNEHSNSVLNVITDAMKECLVAVMPGAVVFYDVNIAELCVTANDKIYLYSNLSDGYRCVISMILDICRRILELNPQLMSPQGTSNFLVPDILKDAHGIVLIDEIELHLHPKWQQQVLNDLTRIFPNIQFIVTTHAPSIINSTEKKHLIMLDENEVFYPGETYGNDVNSILQNIMGVSARPDMIEDEIKTIYHLIDEEDYNTANAYLSKLRQKLGDNDPEVIALGVTIDLEQAEI